MPFKTKRVVVQHKGNAYSETYLDRYSIKGKLPALSLGDQVELEGTENSRGPWVVVQVAVDHVKVRRPF